MVKDTKRGAKSEVLSMRMDPTTRFLVDFIARYRGQSITTVVDRAIQQAADSIDLEDSNDIPFNNKWTDFWHVSEGIRSLKMWSEKKLYPNYEEQFIVSFANTHWPFFYVNDKRAVFREVFIDIIWPRIDEFAEIWRKTKSTDHWAAGKTMQEAIRGAGVQPPDWPPKPLEKPAQVAPASKGRLSSQLDDDIPF